MLLSGNLSPRFNKPTLESSHVNFRAPYVYTAAMSQRISQDLTTATITWFKNDRKIMEFKKSSAWNKKTTNKNRKNMLCGFC